MQTLGCFPHDYTLSNARILPKYQPGSLLGFRRTFETPTLINICLWCYKQGITTRKTRVALEIVLWILPSAVTTETFISQSYPVFLD